MSSDNSRTGCSCDEASRAKAWARRILGNTPVKGASGKCSKCGIAAHREGILIEHPLRRNVPYMEKDVAENVHLPFRLALNRYISGRCELDFEKENLVTNRVYAQLVLDDSSIVDDLQNKYEGDFTKLPSDLLETVNGIIDDQTKQVLKGDTAK
ncbi:hypothetical protein F5X99DRAFT_404860 [Biscogniauxia marginata]|nr:hypothetical protein F5X99DRAFT_404860 [Biscogniauxia marginata]